MEGARTRPRETDLACARTADRSHPSAARALRRNGLADPGRCDLRHRAALRRHRPATACPRDRSAALQEPRADPRYRAGAAAYARAPDVLRLAWRRQCRLLHRQPRSGGGGRSVNRFLDALRRQPIVLGPTHLAVGQLGEDRTGRRQGLAVDLARLIPQLRADDRLGALEVGALDGDDQYAFRDLAVDDEALGQLRVGADPGAAVNAWSRRRQE